MLAVVLARNDIKEFDQMISLYTREQGKLELLAKGIKKIVSKNSANGEVLACVDIEAAQGKDVDYLTKVQPVMLFKNIYSDFDKIFLATYVVGMLDGQLLVGEKDERIFELLLSFLHFLDEARSIVSVRLAGAFIYKLRHLLGMGGDQVQYQQWLSLRWDQINELSVSEVDDIVMYQAVLQSTQQQSHKKLANFIENGRIM